MFVYPAYVIDLCTVDSIKQHGMDLDSTLATHDISVECCFSEYMKARAKAYLEMNVNAIYTSEENSSRHIHDTDAQ